MPSEIFVWSHRVRSCFVERDQLVVSSQFVPALRASVNNMSASNPADLRVIRQQCMNGSRQADGLAGQLEPLQMRADAAAVALVEDQVEHMQHGSGDVAPAPRWSATGMARRKP